MGDTKKHLPYLGSGPFIVGPVIAITILVVAAVQLGWIEVLHLNKIISNALKVLGILSILVGLFMLIYATFIDKFMNYVYENKLITTGMFSLTRNPIYAGWFFICIGLLFWVINLWTIFFIPIFLMYMTIVLKKTEEKWLFNLYGEEYKTYCKAVNRFMPIPKIKK